MAEEKESASWSSMKGRLYLGQHESLRIKRAKLVDPQHAELNIIQKEVKGIKFMNTGKAAQRVTTPDMKEYKQARLSSHGIPAELIPELVARRARSASSSSISTHHLDFWGETSAGEASSSEALSLATWSPLRGSSSPKDPLSSTPQRKSQKRPMSSNSVSWKSKRGRFAEEVPGLETEPYYEWMPFLKLLKENPDYPEFVYLQPPKISSSAFDPYELEIVTHNELDSPYYYTMSSAGVTLFRDSDAEYSPLDDWEREYASYKCIMKLDVFRQYKLWKSFAIWRHFVRRKVQGHSKKGLRKQLFTVNIVLQKVLLRVREMLVNIESSRYYKLDIENPYTLAQFIQVQEARRDELTKQFQQLSSDVIVTLKEGCTASLGLIDEEIMGRQQIETGGPPPAAATGEPSGAATPKRRSTGTKLASVAAKWKMDKEKQMEEKENQERFTFAIAAAKRNAKFRLLNFLRLVDYMITDTLRGILIKSMQQLVYRVAHPTVKHLVLVPDQDEASPPRKRGSVVTAPTKRLVISPQVFEVELVLENDQIVILPSYSTFDNKFGHHLRSIVRRMKALRRLIYVPELDEVVEKGNMEVGDNPSTYMDLIGEGQPNALSSAMNSSITLVFQDGEQRKLEYNPFVEMFLQNATFSIERMEKELKEKKRDIETFRSDMDLFLKQIHEINELPTFNDVGIFRISNVRLKGSLLPSPQRALQAVFTLLPQLGSRLYQEFIGEIHQATKKLLVKPRTVDDFVEIASFLQTMQEKADLNEEQFSRIKSYYQLMDEYKVPVPELEYASYQMMSADFSACKDAMISAEEGKVDNVKIFSAELVKQLDQLKVEVEAIKQEAQAEMILDDNSEMEAVLAYVRKLSRDIGAKKAHFNKINNYQKIFQVEETRWDELHTVVDEVEMKHALWAALEDMGIKQQQWASVHFEKLDVEELEEIITKYTKLAVKLERGLLPNKVVGRLRRIVDEFRLTLPVIQNLRNKALKDRHYKKIENELGQKLVRDATFTLGRLLDLKVMDHKAAIGNISNEATQEAALEDLLQKVLQKWTTIEFVIKPYKEMKDVYIMGGVDEVIVALEDSMVTMNTVTSSRYVAGIRNEVEKLENQLKHFGKVLDEWMECQKQWMYLESIFSAPDIQRQLPNESKAFIAVDKQFKEIMKRTHDRPNALQTAATPIILETFQKSNETLEKIQKNLEDYLETKRMAFPRFYFLSNDELLEILAQTRNVQAVQPHMSKCFDGIRRLDFGEDPKSIDIYAMISSEGERILLGKNLKARGNVENWLTSVEQNMVSSLRRLAKLAHMDYAKRERKVWVLKHPAQLVIMISSVYWCHGVESCLAAQDVEATLSKFKDKCIKQLEDLSELVRGQLQPLERKILAALITIDVHARDIVEDMISNQIFKFSDFGWQMQLRYYWDDTLDDCIVRQTNARFVYAYEYLGAQARLVITPLTDRCYMTLTGALHLKLGGAPAGPAGTGKTETTKDLGKALGIQCVVFNCGDNLDYKFMGKFFAGLAQCGAWACFDEFNRIDIEVLSVVAQQLLTIQNALKASVSRFNFEGREIKLLPTCGVFITMNPGYAGRTELPDNLKVLFRPVSMMIPDYALVAEVMLFSEGFGNAKILSRKMVKLYKLSSEQLSQQDHYDFGMRAVKSVLVMAGSLKRANPDLDEDVVLIRAFKDSNLPKFLAQDVHLFLAIISDLFPGVVIPRQDFGDLQSSIETCLLEAGLQPVPAYVTKVIQLYETMNVRFGVMAVGPTGGGKTACYKTLQSAMTKLRLAKHPNQSFQISHSYVLNPKCIKMGELYGEYNLLTSEWTDGLASTIMRMCVADTTNERKWVVFDGPVDAIWIENMNTVLDDNCILCLPNGERIKLNPTTMRMLFEVQDLAVASPATVSRCGMVYVPPEELGWRPFVKSWMQRLQKAWGLTEGIPAPVTELIWNLFDTYVDIGLKFLRQECKENIPSVNINIVASLCNYFQSLAHPSRQLNLKVNMDLLGPAINKIFAFSYVWSIGGNINHLCVDKFDAFFRAELEVMAAFPGGGTVFEYFVSMKEQNFAPWDDIVAKFKFTPGAPFFTLMVPTQDSTRMSFLMEVNLEVDRAVLFQGVSGAGKSAIIYDLLNRLCENKNYVSIVLNFSAQTTSIATQETIESKLEKKRKTRYGAPAGKRVVCFVDDVNMPAKEKYGAQPPIELLRQFLDFKGFYDRQQLFWKDIEEMTIVSACAPPGGGRNEVTPRYFRHFSMVCVQPPSEASLRTIFGAILGGFLQLFSAECKQYQKPIVECTIEVYLRISQELLPTPTRSHYTFNLRDVSKVFQGILMVKPADCNTKKALRGLWVHECMRVFHDRLINADDRTYFTQMLHDLLKRSLEENSSHKEVFEDKALMYGDYLRPGVAAEDRRYELVGEPQKLPLLFKDYLEDYNMSTTNVMKLVFFKDAIEHVSRISRILRQPRGNAMLVGVGGSGKQSLTRFAAFLAEYKCFQIELKKGYNMNDFREDLKKLYKLAGVEGHPAVFLFTDTQIVNEGFVEDINNLLNSGEVPGLYAPDEKDRIGAEMREYVSQLGLPETKDVLYASFINRTRDNLHVVLCMSPIGEAFRARCRQFPSLINCCTIDWFNEWPDEALLSVSNHFLAPVDLSSDEIKAKVAKICVEIHLSVSNAADKFYEELRRKYYITPKSYLDCVNLYIQLLSDKREESVVAEDRFLNGLNKLKETNELIDGMKTDLNKLQPILTEKAEATAILLAQVARDQESAQKVKDVVQMEEAEVKSQAEATQLIKDDAQRDLDAALPAMNAAVTALNSLNKNDITEIKSFTKPPPLVLLTMEGVCVLLGEKPDWDTSKKVMSDVQFIKRLIEYDKDGMTPMILKKLVRYIEDPNFLPEIVQKQSAAATSLCMWVRAMDVYAKVAKVVAPKKETLRQAEAALKLSAEKLAAKQKQLADVEAQVAVLKKNLENTEAEQKLLQDQAMLTENRLIRAGKLTSALADEAVRWRETADEIASKRIMLVGDVFICAACISYYGAFSGPYREVLVSSWVARLQEEKIPVSVNCSLRAVLSTPVEVREWSIWGLPTDDVSVDNGILVTRGKRWPLMIDPQGQANSWVKAMESKNGLRVLRLNDPNLLRTLESSIRIGNPVLLEEIGDTIDPSLEPILQKQIFEKKGRFLIRLGDTDVDYDPNFKLYMTTKMSNPHYMPDVCIKVTLVNFTVTMKGLEDQLLGDVVRKERADLEEQNDRLVVSISSDKKQLKDLEDKILKLLKESEGNILDDEVLINTLNTSKVTSAVIQKRVKQAEITEKEITAAREQYRVVANRGSILYFVIADLALIDSMYQYSLSFFSQLFNRCIDISEKSDELDIRLNILIKFITEFLYANVSRGLFEEHKITFSFLIGTSILRHAGDIKPHEWNFFLRGAIGAPPNRLPNPAPDNITEKIWNELCALEASFKDNFGGLTKAIGEQLSDWKAYLKVPEPHNTPFPSNWDEKIEPFHRLLLMKALRGEKLVYAIENYIRLKLGPTFIGTAPLQLEEVFKDTTNTTPVIFILSTGADPSGMLQRFAEKVDKKPGERLHMISLGQGQGPIAEMLMAKSRKTGDWVCLQNCHLASSWMATMERIIERFLPEKEEIHPEFRLWLTSLPSKDFPVPVLQNGIKITNEPPKGVRANLLQSYANIPEDYIENCTKKGPWKKLVFAIAFFHAVIQERRKFGPLGWNVKYDFNSSDLECAMATLHMFLEEQEEIPWPALLYVTGEITYGGRVTDDLDRRCLLSTLRRYYDPAVLSDSYPFTPSRIYMSPPEGMYTYYVDYIKSLPSTEGPDVFGMHENANVTFQLQETTKVLNTVLNIQPRTSAAAAGGKTPDEIVAELAAGIAEKLPGPLKLDPESPALALGPDGQLSSLGVVLTQEAERFNKLLKVITFTLIELQRAIKGLVVMSAELESMFNNFLNNQVPGLWQAVAYPSLKPLSSWMLDFHKRMAFMEKWLREGTPKCFWLPGFFFPQGFMTGALQTHARKYQIPIDTLNFGFKVMTMEDEDEVDVAPEDGVYISGLFLDGARWDRKHRWLTEALPGIMHSRLPVVHFTPVVNYKTPPDEYQCPLYKTHVRAGVLTTTGASSNYILNVSLRISPETNPDYWVLQGIAALCQLGD